MGGHGITDAGATGGDPMEPADDVSDTGSGRSAVRIAAVAALGGFLFGYDSAVVNGAVDAIQKQFEIAAQP